MSVTPSKVTATIWAAVDHTGAWSAGGWGDAGKPASMEEALVVDTLEEGERRYKITVELEVPSAEGEPVSVEAVEVVDASDG